MHWKVVVFMKQMLFVFLRICGINLRYFLIHPAKFTVFFSLARIIPKFKCHKKSLIEDMSETVANVFTYLFLVLSYEFFSAFILWFPFFNNCSNLRENLLRKWSVWLILVFLSSPYYVGFIFITKIIFHGL